MNLILILRPSGSVVNEREHVHANVNLAQIYAKNRSDQTHWSHYVTTLKRAQPTPSPIGTVEMPANQPSLLVLARRPRPVGSSLGSAQRTQHRWC
jgi:hypothetical protein